MLVCIYIVDILYRLNNIKLTVCVDSLTGTPVNLSIKRTLYVFTSTNSTSWSRFTCQVILSTALMTVPVACWWTRRDFFPTLAFRFAISKPNLPLICFLGSTRLILDLFAQKLTHFVCKKQFEYFQLFNTRLSFVLLLKHIFSPRELVASTIKVLRTINLFFVVYSEHILLHQNIFFCSSHHFLPGSPMFVQRVL